MDLMAVGLFGPGLAGRLAAVAGPMRGANLMPLELLILEQEREKEG